MTQVLNLIPVAELTRDQAMQELARLAETIQYHDIQYFERAAPEISDAEYDELVRRNRQIEALFPDLRRLDSPTRRIGVAPAQGFGKVKHRQPMLSLDNAFTAQDVIDFFAKAKRFLQLAPDIPLPIMAEPKIDGLSASLHYQNGKFILGATRGDGSVGEDITANLRTVKDIPLILSPGSAKTLPESLEVRGEIYMTRQDFFDLNTARQQMGEAEFANPRNGAAGSIRQLDPQVTAARPLRFFAYAYETLSGNQAQTQEEILLTLKAWGFSISSEVKLCHTFEEILEYYEHMEGKRPTLPYDIDGVVYKVNDLALQKRLGSIGRSPRHSLAHKFAAEQAETTITNIVVQVGRTGVLTPVAHLAPINVGGVMVRRATLHNEDEICRKDIRINDHVIIQRAGDVIPQVVQVIIEKRLSDSKPYIFPHQCPVCGGEAYRNKKEVARRCSNGLQCPAQAMERLKHFVSRQAFDIEGLGAKNIESFYKDGLIRTPADIFTLKDRHVLEKVPLQRREGWGVQSVQNLLKAIEERRTISLSRFIYALGIPQVGVVTATLLARHYQTIENWVHQLQQAGQENAQAYAELLALEGIGENMAADIIHFFQQFHNREVVQALSGQLSIEPYMEDRSFTTPVSNKIVVFTGSLTLLSRAEAKAQAERLGAKVTGSVTQKTDYVVVGEDPGSKAKQAAQLGISILTEAQWMELIQPK